MIKNLNCLLLLLVLFVSVFPIQSWSQEAQLVPTGRALPDTVPNDEVIYLGPLIKGLDNIDPLYAPAPDNAPTFIFDPVIVNNTNDEQVEQPIVENIEPPILDPQFTPRGEPDGSPELTPVYVPSQNPEIAINDNDVPYDEPNPNYSINSTPQGTPDYEPGGYIPPSKQVENTPGSFPSDAPDGYIGPNKNISVAPVSDIEDVPSDEVLQGPDSVVDAKPYVNILPLLDEDSYHNPEIDNNTVEDTQTDTTENKWFTLQPTDDQYPQDTKETVSLPARTEKNTIEDNQVIQFLEPKEPKDISDKQVVTLSAPNQAGASNTVAATRTDYEVQRLRSGKYIQLFSYKDSYRAEEKAGNIANDYSSIISKDKIMVYKPNNSSYYRIYLGPYNPAEIGVELYTLRAQGFTKAIAVSQ